MHETPEPLEVTDENFGAVLIAGLKEAIAFDRGELPARIRVRHRTPADVTVHAPPVYDAPRVRAVRQRLALSQEMFARALNVSDQTVRAWEQGTRPPSGSSLRLLELAEEHPTTLLAKIEQRQ
ncbi:MAG: helix-turn-helix domain-containing protein [Thermomicrobia bacterium]|nr:helix-turn-helix domain-containing protein [Thermomicrobia bacterium]MCA1725524.1 helix-turn-helix domain-containing protein [Thermomicrobia bacterium]